MRVSACKGGSVWILEIIVRLARYLTKSSRKGLIWYLWLSLLNYRVIRIAFRLSD